MTANFSERRKSKRDNVRNARLGMTPIRETTSTPDFFEVSWQHADAESGAASCCHY